MSGVTIWGTLREKIEGKVQPGVLLCRIRGQRKQSSSRLDILETTTNTDTYMKADQFKDQTIIHGTGLSEDLYPAFLHLLVLLDPAKARGYAEAADFPTDEDTWDLLLEIDSLAPAGYYFGSHQGDGSDYGFWESEGDQ